MNASTDDADDPEPWQHKGYEDRQYHDEDLEISQDEGAPPRKSKPGRKPPRRLPSPRRRFEED